jgi:peptidoglycan/xylan/chitin deacetylase (PgdA/CDA1 family)
MYDLMVDIVILPTYFSGAHGIMFHHFHGEQYAASQGSIDRRQLTDLLKALRDRRILSPDEWRYGASRGSLHEMDICLTFDDCLADQFDIALPVLEQLGANAFWFVYSSVLQGGIERLEVYRKFRCSEYRSVDDFYIEFFEACTNCPCASRVVPALRSFVPQAFLPSCTFYSDNDKRFRYVRDEILSSAEYDEVMEFLMSSRGIDIAAYAEGLWISAEQLRRLVDRGDVIGLHSHTHPTRMAYLETAEQRREYTMNQETIEDITGVRPWAMSHPCNSYNEDTLRVLREIGVEVGFRADLMLRPHSALEQPRVDHAHLMKMLNDGR